MVLSGWRLLISRSPGRRLVGVGKASDEGCLLTCFGQTSVVAAGAELVQSQGVEVEWSRDESPARLGTASSRHCTKKEAKRSSAKNKQYEGKLCSPQALSEKTDAPELGVYVLIYRSQQPTVALAACQHGKCSVCSLTILCSLTALAACQRGKCSVCSLTIVCSLKLSYSK